jgi:hypothetical protein
MASDFMKAQEFDFTEHKLLRQQFHWGSFGKQGDEPKKTRHLQDLSTNHIYNILRTQHFSTEQRDMFVLELCYRIGEK